MKIMKREQTRAVRVGGLQIGGQERVVIQSMCNTPTKDAEATIAQIQRLQEAGCTVYSTRDYGAVSVWTDGSRVKIGGFIRPGSINR